MIEYKKENMNLEKIPDEVLENYELEHLSLRYNNIQEIPEELFNLTKLRILGLSENKIKKIPKGISKLKNLEQLYLGNNQLSEIPNEIFELKNLKILGITGNNYTKLSEKIINLQKLEQLALNDKITNIPKEVIDEYKKGNLSPIPIFKWINVLKNMKINTRNNWIKLLENIQSPSIRAQLQKSWKPIEVHENKIIVKGTETAINNKNLITGELKEASKKFFNAIPNIEILKLDNDEDLQESQTYKMYKKENINIANFIKKNDDYLNRAIYAKALSKIIKAKDTTPPLNIGLYAKWGSGKTHLINLIKKECEETDNKELEIIPIEFDAWEYQDQEKIWAALIECILKEYRKTSVFHYFKFIIWKVHNQFKQRWGEYFAKFICIFTLFFLITKTFLILYPNEFLYRLSFMEFSESWLPVAFLSLLTIFVPTLIKYPLVNLDTNFLKYLESPSYKENLGFRDEIQNIITFAINAISNNNKKRIVLFIDNLDRCSYEKIIQVIDSICLLLNNCCGGKNINEYNLISVFAIDKRIIELAIKSKLKIKENEKSLPKNDNNQKIINEYLDKIITLPFFIPYASKDQLISKILELDENYTPRFYKDLHSGFNKIRDTKTSQQENDSNEVSDKPYKPSQDALQEDNSLKMELEDDEKFYLKEVLNYLDKNSSYTPRQIIHFVYAFKLYRYILGAYLIDYTPQILAWWIGLIFAFPNKVYHKTISDINNDKDEAFQNYFNTFCNKLAYGNEKLYMEFPSSELLAALQNESKILIDMDSLE